MLYGHFSKPWIGRMSTVEVYKDREKKEKLFQASGQTSEVINKVLDWGREKREVIVFEEEALKMENGKASGIGPSHR